MEPKVTHGLPLVYWLYSDLYWFCHEKKVHFINDNGGGHAVGRIITLKFIDYLWSLTIPHEINLQNK